MSEDFKKHKQNSDILEEEIAEEDKLKKMQENEDRLEEETGSLAKAKEENDEKRKKELERLYAEAEKKKKAEEKKKEEEKEQKMIAGQKIPQRKFFEHGKEEGVFRHKKLSLGIGGTKKIERVLNKVHGVSTEQKRKFLQTLLKYNSFKKSGKSILTKDSLREFAVGVKRKAYSGSTFQRLKKVENLKDLRFKKREVDKIKMALTGEKDPYKFQSKRTDQQGSKTPPQTRSSNLH